MASAAPPFAGPGLTAFAGAALWQAYGSGSRAPGNHRGGRCGDGLACSETGSTKARHGPAAAAVLTASAGVRLLSAAFGQLQAQQDEATRDAAQAQTDATLLLELVRRGRDMGCGLGHRCVKQRLRHWCTGWWLVTQPAVALPRGLARSVPRRFLIFFLFFLFLFILVFVIRRCSAHFSNSRGRLIGCSRSTHCH